MPYIKNRPLSLVRCPNPGINKYFYQKNWIAGLPKGISKVKVKTSKGASDYVMINNRVGLIAAAQMDVLELHPWASRKDKLNYPDQIIFDLDPGPEITWKELVSAAFLIRKLLTALKLKSFVKLTGGKGLHLVIPIARRRNFSEIKNFSKKLADQLAAQFPKQFTSHLKKAKRKNKIFVDYLRNGYGATAIAPFSSPF